jgi:hypothetical protein
LTDRVRRPTLFNRNGKPMDRHAATRRLRRLATAAAIARTAYRARQARVELPAPSGRRPPGAYAPQDVERYVEAWSQPTAMINYYRGRAEVTFLDLVSPSVLAPAKREARSPG